MAQTEDRPIIVGGGPHHITVQLPDPTPNYPAKEFSLAPKDPAVPFKQIVITEGANEIFRWDLADDWKITIE